MVAEIRLLFAFGVFALAPVTAAAAPSLALYDRYNVYSFDASALHTETPAWVFQGKQLPVPRAFRVDGDAPPALPEGVSWGTRLTWDEFAIADALSRRIAPAIHQESGEATLSTGTGGELIFEGRGLPGRQLDIPAATMLIVAALSAGANHVLLPIVDVQPTLTIASNLRQRGIREVIAVGESDFSGSPVNRRHNIGVGIARMNGVLIAKDSEFSFDKQLGPVDGGHGYRQELVIKGDKTLPDFGGGLCQVSTTVYRGAWTYGLPITKRINHSFAVHYYSPVGTDATIYPPNIDMKFKNDTQGDIALQSFTEGNHAYVIYYGTKDSRHTTLAGPFTWGHQEPPPDRTEKTAEIPPGTTRKVGERVPGLKAAWFRTVSDPVTGSSDTQGVYSIYEARPHFLQIGVPPEELPQEPADDALPLEQGSLDA